MRNTGLDVIEKASWGTHLCHFYHTKEDLLEILVPYFKQGLENNEACLWITSDPLQAEEARAALQIEVEDLDYRISKCQIEILDYRQWYVKSGRFEADRVLTNWVKWDMKVFVLPEIHSGLRKVSGKISRIMRPQ